MTPSPGSQRSVGEGDRLAPLLEVRRRKIAELRRVREAVEVRLHLLRVTVDDADRTRRCRRRAAC